jgi:disulfide bond formation protein DsbB
MSKISGYTGYIAFGVALMATLGSLMFSELFKWVPCDLCWYQRVFMYPLVFVMGIGIVRRDHNWAPTALALAVVGWFLALYHSLLQWGIIPSSLAPCTGGVSCAVKEVEPWLGFITIPFMSLMAFTVIIVATTIFWKGVQQNDEGN